MREHEDSLRALNMELRRATSTAKVAQLSNAQKIHQELRDARKQAQEAQVEILSLQEVCQTLVNHSERDQEKRGRDRRDPTGNDRQHQGLPPRDSH